MGVAQSAAIGAVSLSPEHCLLNALPSNSVAFPAQRFFQWTDVRSCNLDLSITPTAITYPQTNEHVAAIIRCAREFEIKVQARSGGHSFGNYGKHLQSPSRII